MFSQDDDGQQGLVLALVLGLVALVLALTIGVAIKISGSWLAAPGSSQAAAVRPVPAAAAAVTSDPGNGIFSASDDASVKVENGVVKFYFVSGKADLAPGSEQALVDVIAGARSGRKLLISGYHDTTGDAVKNAELAKKRALVVRDALKAAGLADSQLELKNPEQLQSGHDAEARRVEVSLQ